MKHSERLPGCDSRPAVYIYVHNPLCMRKRLLKGRAVDKSLRIENNHIRIPPHAQIPASPQTEDVCGKSATAADRLRERNDLFTHRVVPNLTRKRPKAARMWPRGPRDLSSAV